MVGSAMSTTATPSLGIFGSDFRVDGWLSVGGGRGMVGVASEGFPALALGQELLCAFQIEFGSLYSNFECFVSYFHKVNPCWQSADSVFACLNYFAASNIVNLAGSSSTLDADDTLVIPNVHAIIQ